MYEEEIMNNEEVLENEEEMTEEINVKKSHKGLLAFAMVGGIAVLAGTVAYKKLIKPIIDKRKADAEIDESRLILEGDYDDDSNSEEETE